MLPPFAIKFCLEEKTKMKKKTVCCSDLGAYINELLKRAKLKNEYVCETLGMGHDVLNGIKKG